MSSVGYLFSMIFVATVTVAWFYLFSSLFGFTFELMTARGERYIERELFVLEGKQFELIPAGLYFIFMGLARASVSRETKPRFPSARWRAEAWRIRGLSPLLATDTPPTAGGGGQ